MTSTSTPSRETNWLLIVLAVIGLLVVSPFIFAFLIVGLALTIGLAAKLLKVALVVLAVWALVAVLRKAFGGAHPTRLAKTTRVAQGFSVPPDAEMERERKASLAELDRELARAIAQQKDAEAQ